MDATQHPTWNDDIQLLLAEPYWIEEVRRKQVGDEWRNAMSGYFVCLDQYASVKEWSVTIYNHLHSRNMPLTSDKTQLWPDEALEEFRTWVNEGFRQSASDPFDVQERIPAPRPRPVPLRVRKNIVHMTESELNEYRMKLEDMLITHASPTAPWQQMGYLHTNWCLHYQEAFLLWHRANMVYFEELIDFPVPYWNWMSPNVAKDGDAEAGLPQAFKDETYVHPRTGEVRPNPLKYAAAKGGRSKLCESKELPPAQSWFVQRDPVLYTQGDDQREARQEKLNLLIKYQEQVRNAFQWKVFSTPQGSPGYPWANIPTFPAPDSSYPNCCDFDGRFEQPHDNYHGWVGPDMADNAYTAFDPVFWSHHAMIDMVFEEWLRANPAAMYTASYPLQPFVGPQAREVDEADPRRFIYTTIGDMAKDSRSLGYDFQGFEAVRLALAPTETFAHQLTVAFEGVRCTYDSYAIDIFLGLKEPPKPEDAKTANPHFLTRMMRLGMGMTDDKGRCVKDAVTRIIDASRTARDLGLDPSATVPVHIIVTEVRSGRQLTEAEYTQLPGFTPRAIWSSPTALGTPPVRAPQKAGSSGGGNCCH